MPPCGLCGPWRALRQRNRYVSAKFAKDRKARKAGMCLCSRAQASNVRLCVMARRTLYSIILMGCFILSVGSPTLAQSTRKPSRDEATKAIRVTVYEMMKAFLTQDVGTFKKYAAKRTIDLVGITYEAAQKDPRYQGELQSAGVTNADQFLGYFMLGLATQYLQTMPLSPEAAARHAANDSTVTFVSDVLANVVVNNIEVAHARLVGKQWKIDLTDWLKKGVLREVTDPAIRARIKSL